MNADLCTLASVKEWLDIGQPGATVAYDGGADGLLRRLIRAASTFVLNQINRDTVVGRDVVEAVDAFGGPFIMLRQAPASAVTSAVAGATSYGASDLQLSPANLSQATRQRLGITNGRCWPRGFGAVMVNYRAGWETVEQLQVPASAPYTVPVSEMWAADGGVTRAGGAALAGGYTIDPDTRAYVFTAADAGQAVAIAYSYVPADLAQATIELVGERFRARTRIGMVTNSLGQQQSVSYSQKDMNENIRSALAPFKPVAPI